MSNKLMHPNLLYASAVFNTLKVIFPEPENAARVMDLTTKITSQCKWLPAEQVKFRKAMGYPLPAQSEKKESEATL